MRKIEVTTTDDYEKFTAYVPDGKTGVFYMDVNGLSEFFYPYDVRILQAGELGNNTNDKQALIYTEDEIRLNPFYWIDDNGDLITILFDMSEFELMEVE